jgi:hypothetical protein
LINGAPLRNSYYYNKIKGKSIHTAICFLGLDQYNNPIINSALLNLVFANISDVSASISSSPVLTLDKYHPPLLLDFDLSLKCHRVSLTPRRSYAQGDYLLLCNGLRHSDWFYIRNENSLDPAVNNLTAIVREDINIALPYIKSKKKICLPTLVFFFFKSLY